MQQAATGLVLASLATIILGAYEVGLFLAISAGLLAVFAPSERSAARKRSQAHRIK